MDRCLHTIISTIELQYLNHLEIAAAGTEQTSSGMGCWTFISWPEF